MNILVQVHRILIDADDSGAIVLNPLPPGTSDRITEASEQRITEDGDNRVTE